uniref:Uncharacterized protein n=1 Tax=Lotus japonicus TaxID=34305 RepID=I3SR17_LOTJA|nr:unknown [Lotus japonicus]
MLPLRMTLTLLGHQQRPFQKSELRSKPLVDNSSRVQPYCNTKHKLVSIFLPSTHKHH